jgi:hypothetical protein
MTVYDKNPTIVMSTDPPSQRHIVESRLLTDAATLQEQRNLSEADALEEAARLDPGNYRRVRGYNTGYLSEPGTSLSKNATEQFADLVNAKVQASGDAMTYGEAFEEVAKEHPKLFSDYRAEWAHV